MTETVVVDKVHDGSEILHVVRTFVPDTPGSPSRRALPPASSPPTDPAPRSGLHCTYSAQTMAGSRRSLDPRRVVWVSVFPRSPLPCSPRARGRTTPTMSKTNVSTPVVAAALNRRARRSTESRSGQEVTPVLLTGSADGCRRCGRCSARCRSHPVTLCAQGAGSPEGCSSRSTFQSGPEVGAHTHVP